MQRKYTYDTADGIIKSIEDEQVKFPCDLVCDIENSITGEKTKITLTLISNNITVDELKNIHKKYPNEIYLAFYWPKHFLPDYEPCLDVPCPQDGFKHNLDICSIFMINKRKSHIIAMSIETEGMYNIRANELQFTNNKNYRTCVKTPFNVYLSKTITGEI